jgi:hypothetical protein
VELIGAKLSRSRGSVSGAAGVGWLCHGRGAGGPGILMVFAAGTECKEGEGMDVRMGGAKRIGVSSWKKSGDIRFNPGQDNECFDRICHNSRSVCFRLDPSTPSVDQGKPATVAPEESHSPSSASRSWTRTRNH